MRKCPYRNAVHSSKVARAVPKSAKRNSCTDGSFCLGWCPDHTLRVHFRTAPSGFAHPLREFPLASSARRNICPLRAFPRSEGICFFVSGLITEEMGRYPSVFRVRHFETVCLDQNVHPKTCHATTFHSDASHSARPFPWLLAPDGNALSEGSFF